MSYKNNQLINIIKKYKVKLFHITNDENSEINKRVKKIFVINLLGDVVKRNYIIILMKKYKINYTLVIVERISKELHKELCFNKSLISRSEMGCCLSHLWCLYQIILNNYENAIVFEDDVIFHKNFTELFLKIHNDKMNFLLLGAHDFSFVNVNHVNVHNSLYRPSIKGKYNLYGAHANYYSLKGARRMFEIRVSEISFFDKEYLLMFDYYKDSSFICYPNLCVSNITASTINHAREILTDLEYKYYKSCFINFNFKDYHFIYINLLTPSIRVTESDNYESFMEKCLYYYFHDKDRITAVKNRLTIDFFTLKDLLYIIQYTKHNVSNLSTESDNKSHLSQPENNEIYYITS
jgi:GR25 family glycosyltransferase involved in LPS biosynthesis